MTTIFNVSLDGKTGRDAMRHIGKDEVLRAIAEHGQLKVSQALGMASSSVLSVALADLGWRERGERSSNGDGRRSALKVKGCLPLKTASAVRKALGLTIDPDDDDFRDVNYEDYLKALSMQGNDWLTLLFTRLGGVDSEGGQSFRQWIDSNAAIAERAADPTYQLRQKLSAANELANSRACQITELQKRISELESEVQQVRRNGRVQNGGEITAAMKKLMQQRFHPDKQNGNDPDLYNALSSWINALQTTD